jgi:hypothetical protein
MHAVVRVEQGQRREHILNVVFAPRVDQIQVKGHDGRPMRHRRYTSNKDELDMMLTKYLEQLSVRWHGSFAVAILG